MKALELDPETEEKRLGVRPYAVVNIAVLRAVRDRQGEVVYIAQANEDTAWGSSTSNLFETKFDDSDSD